MINDNKLLARLEDYFERDNLIFYSRAIVGIEVLLKIYKREYGFAYVAIPLIVCHDILKVILKVGFKPFFCDVELSTGLVKESEWQRAKLNGAKIAIVVHTYGNFINCEFVKKIFSEKNNLIIDDAAQALGTSSNGVKAGTRGDVGVFSFGQTKQISRHGAILLFNNNDYFEMALNLNNDIVDGANQHFNESRFACEFNIARNFLKEHNRTDKFYGLLDSYNYSVNRFGYHGFQDELISDFINIDSIISERQEKAYIWRALLCDLGFKPLGMDLESGCSPWRFTCVHDKISSHKQLFEIGDAIRSLDIETSHWYFPLYWYISRDRNLSFDSERLSAKIFQFWIDASVSKDDIARSVDLIRTLPFFR